MPFSGILCNCIEASLQNPFYIPYFSPIVDEPLNRSTPSYQTFLLFHSIYNPRINSNPIGAIVYPLEGSKDDFSHLFRHIKLLAVKSLNQLT